MHSVGFAFLLFDGFSLVDFGRGGYLLSRVWGRRTMVTGSDRPIESAGDFRWRIRHSTRLDSPQLGLVRLYDETTTTRTTATAGLRVCVYRGQMSLDLSFVFSLRGSGIYYIGVGGVLICRFRLSWLGSTTG